MKSQPRFPSLCAVLLVVCLFGLAGCRSASEPGGTSHASVQIKGHSLGVIQQTITAVFREEGYTLTASSPQEMIFDRPGSRRDVAKWGGLYGGLVMRVKVSVSDSLEGHLLQADAFAVQNPSDPFYQTENRNMMLNRGPYQKLLNEVARRLK